VKFESKKLCYLEGNGKAKNDEEIAPPQISNVNTVSNSEVIFSGYDIATTLRTEEGASLIGTQNISIQYSTSAL